MTVAPRPPRNPPAQATGSARRTYDRDDLGEFLPHVGSELTRRWHSRPAQARSRQSCGTLYRHVPAAWSAGGSWVAHPFDGDAYSRPCALNPARQPLQCFVPHEGRVARKPPTKVLYSGRVRHPETRVARRQPPFDLRLKTSPNTPCCALGDKLAGAVEASHRTPLDPDTWKTRGLDLMEGHPGGAARPSVPILASIRAHHGERRMVTFGIKSGARSTVRLIGVRRQRPPEQLKLNADQKHKLSPALPCLHELRDHPELGGVPQNAMSFNPARIRIRTQRGRPNGWASSPNPRASSADPAASGGG